MIRRSSLILLEVAAGILAVIALGVGLLAWRLSQGPIPLPMVEAFAERQLIAARGGRPVDLEDVALAWGGTDRGLVVVASRVRVFDAAGAVQTAADGVDIGIDLASLALGRTALSSLAFRGGELTLTLAADGSAKLAFGGPGAAPDLIIPAPTEARALLDQVNWALDAFAQALKPLGPGEALRRLSASGLKLTIQDERGGELWKANDAQLQGARNGASIALSASANFTGPRGPAPASLSISTDDQFGAALVELVARDVRLNALVPSAALGPLDKLRAPVTAAITVGVDRKQGVTKIEGDMTLGRGEVAVAGGKLALNGASVRGRYDLKSDVLVIDEVQLAGARTRVEGEMRFRNASAFLGVSQDKTSPFDVKLSRLELDVPGFLGEPTLLTDVSARGALKIAENAIDLEDAVAYLEGSPARATGRFALGDDGAGVIRPAIKLDATLEGEADVRRIIAFWPKPLDPLSREWTEQRVEAGRVRAARARLDLRPQDLRGAVIPRDRINVTFAFSGARVRFMDGIAPVEQGAGSAVIEGDRLDLILDQATLNGLAIGKGRVYLPAIPLMARDPALYQLTGTGDVKAVVDVLRQAPLQIDAALPFDPATLAGAGAVTVAVRTFRPRANSETLDVRFDVDGRFDAVAATFKQGGARLSDARVTVSGDERALTFSGPAALGASRAEVVWTENFRADPANRSRFAIAGRFDAASLKTFGFDLGDLIEGPIGLEVRGLGDGAAFSTAGVRMDLKQAILRLPAGAWVKPVGQDATLAFQAKRTGDGGVAINDLDLRGEGGVFAAGEAVLGADHRLRSADISRFSNGPRSNVALRAQRAENGALVVEARGQAFDLSPWLAPAKPGNATPAAQPATAQPAETVLLTMDVGRLAMMGDATLSSARLKLDAVGPGLRRLAIDGALPEGGAFSLAIGDGSAAGPLRFSTDDAGFAVRAFTGADNVRGGKATAVGSWRTGAPGRAEFTLNAADFKVVRMGPLAELLSSVSSLTGLVDTLNGEGIAFKGLEAPVVIDNGQMTVRDMRAAGDSLGITAKGNVDLGRGRVALDGVVAPAYGINAMFTDVPVIGTILTSRPGEGVVGITYTVAGTPDQMRVGVNPLSALAPGILRRIFEPWAPREPNRSGRAPSGGRAKTQVAPSAASDDQAPARPLAEPVLESAADRPG